jgi:hypothetical protein
MSMTISTYHLQDKNLSLRAKGLLSVMLTLPDDWRFTLSGLAALCKEGITAVNAAVRELERGGYHHTPPQKTFPLQTRICGV